MRTGNSPRASSIDITSRSLLATRVPCERAPVIANASYVNSGTGSPHADAELARRLKASTDDVAGGDAGDLVQRRLALQHLAPAVLAQGDHPLLEGLVADGGGAEPLHAHVADDVA